MGFLDSVRQTFSRSKPSNSKPKPSPTKTRTVIPIAPTPKSTPGETRGQAAQRITKQVSSIGRTETGGSGSGRSSGGSTPDAIAPTPTPTRAESAVAIVQSVDKAGREQTGVKEIVPIPSKSTGLAAAFGMGGLEFGASSVRTLTGGSVGFGSGEFTDGGRELTRSEVSARQFGQLTTPEKVAFIGGGLTAGITGTTTFTPTTVQSQSLVSQTDDTSTVLSEFKSGKTTGKAIGFSEKVSSADDLTGFKSVGISQADDASSLVTGKSLGVSRQLEKVDDITTQVAGSTSVKETFLKLPGKDSFFKLPGRSTTAQLSQTVSATGDDINIAATRGGIFGKFGGLKAEFVDKAIIVKDTTGGFTSTGGQGLTTTSQKAIEQSLALAPTPSATQFGVTLPTTRPSPTPIASPTPSAPATTITSDTFAPTDLFGAPTKTSSFSPTSISSTKSPGASITGSAVFSTPGSQRITPLLPQPSATDVIFSGTRGGRVQGIKTDTFATDSLIGTRVVPLVSSRSRGTTLTGLDFGLGQSQGQGRSQTPFNIPAIGTALTPVQSTKTPQITRTQTPAITTTGFPTFTPTPLLTPTPLPPFGFLPGFNLDLKRTKPRRGKRAARPKKFAPSLSAVALGITATKAPKLSSITGLGLRPVVRRKRRR